MQLNINLLIFKPSLNMYTSVQLQNIEQYVIDQILQRCLYSVPQHILNVFKMLMST